MEPGREDFPQVPLTLEGSSVLHQMMRVRWGAWKARPAAERAEIAAEAAAALARMEQDAAMPSAMFSLLGHKGDLMLVHFRDSFAALNQVELSLARLRLAEFLEPATSYLSVVELGLYESTLKLYQSLRERAVEPHSAEWAAAVNEVLARQRAAMHPRLYPAMPPHRYLCFYPMDRRRGEHKNWYRLPMAERQRQMDEHGKVGRRYAGTVKQIITGSIGFDDWEWGVDLFAEDPLIFKQLIYEMRFDEVSAMYALFGPFYVGVRVPALRLGDLLEGHLPDAAPRA
jgi:peroxiredoxin